MNMVTRVCIILFLAYMVQSTLAWFQIRRSYKVINDVKTQHQGENCLMVTGTGRTRFLLIQRGYYIIMLVNDEDIIRDYYGMDGYTVFATPRQKKQYIGKSIEEARPTFKKKNEKRAFEAALEQLQLLRDNEKPDKKSEDGETYLKEENV